MAFDRSVPSGKSNTIEVMVAADELVWTWNVKRAGCRVRRRRVALLGDARDLRVLELLVAGRQRTAGAMRVSSGASSAATTAKRRSVRFVSWSA